MSTELTSLCVGGWDADNHYLEDILPLPSPDQYDTSVIDYVSTFPDWSKNLASYGIGIVVKTGKGTVELRVWWEKDGEFRSYQVFDPERADGKPCGNIPTDTGFDMEIHTFRDVMDFSLDLADKVLS